MKNTKGKWGVHNPIYQGKKMTAKGSVSVVRVKDSSSPTGWKYPRYIPDNKICEFVEWGEKDRANANLIASAPEMLEALKSIQNCLRNLCENRGSDEPKLTGWELDAYEIVKSAIVKVEGK